MKHKNDRKNQGRKRTEKGNSNEMRFLSRVREETGQKQEKGRTPLPLGMLPIASILPGQAITREEIGKFFEHVICELRFQNICNERNKKRPN